MNLTELHPAFTIRQAGAGFVVNHWEQPGGAIGMIMRTEARCWELTLWGNEYSFRTTDQLVRYLNTRAAR